MTQTAQQPDGQSKPSRRTFLQQLGLVAVGAAVPALASGRVSAQEQRQYTGTAQLAVQDSLCQTGAVETHEYPATLQLERLPGDPNPLSVGLNPSNPAQFNTPGVLFAVTYGVGVGNNIRFWDLQQVETQNPNTSGIVGQLARVVEGSGAANSLVLERSIIPCRPGPNLVNVYPIGVGSRMALEFTDQESRMQILGETHDQASRFQLTLQATRSR